MKAPNVTVKTGIGVIGDHSNCPLDTARRPANNVVANLRNAMNIGDELGNFGLPIAESDTVMDKLVVLLHIHLAVYLEGMPAVVFSMCFMLTLAAEHILWKCYLLRSNIFSQLPL